MVSSEMESQVMALIAATLRVDQTMVGRDTTFAGDLAADSLDCVTLILAIEDEFRIDIHDEDAAEILTVGQMIEYVTVGQMIEYVTFALSEKERRIMSRAKNVGTVGLR